MQKHVRIVKRANGTKEAVRVRPEHMSLFLAEQQAKGATILEGGRKTAKRSGLGKIRSYSEELRRRAAAR